MDDKKLKNMVRQLAGPGALAWAWKKDKSLVVVNARGEKLHFDAETCNRALEKLVDKSKSKGKKNDKIG